MLKLSLNRSKPQRTHVFGTKPTPEERRSRTYDVDPSDTRMSYKFSDGEHEQVIVHGGKWKSPYNLEKASCCHYHKFKLVELSIGMFAIARADEEEYKMPISIHGFIRVERDTSHKYFAFLVKGLASGELAESKEIDSLLKEALELTEEAVDDEFSD